MQTTNQSNTAHPRQSRFQRINELLRVGLEPMTLYTLDRALYQFSNHYRGSSAGRAQIIVHLMNYQLSMKEKAGVMKPPKTYEVSS